MVEAVKLMTYTQSGPKLLTLSAWVLVQLLGATTSYFCMSFVFLLLLGNIVLAAGFVAYGMLIESFTLNIKQTS